MSMDIIRRGNRRENLKEVKVFLCLECDCIFKTDEYKVEQVNRDGVLRVAVCPDCGNRVTRYD